MALQDGGSLKQVSLNVRSASRERPTYLSWLKVMQRFVARSVRSNLRANTNRSVFVVASEVLVMPVTPWKAMCTPARDPFSGVMLNVGKTMSMPWVARRCSTAGSMSGLPAFANRRTASSCWSPGSARVKSKHPLVQIPKFRHRLQEPPRSRATLNNGSQDHRARDIFERDETEVCFRRRSGVQRAPEGPR